MFKLSKGYPLPAFTLLTVLVAGGYSVHNDSDDRYHHIAYCLSGEVQESECKNVQHFDIDKTAIFFKPRAEYFTPLGNEVETFVLNLKLEEKVKEAFYTYGAPKVEVDFTLSTEPVSDAYERSKSLYSTLGKPTNEDVGSLHMVALWEHGALASEVLIPIGGDGSIFFYCARPYRAISGNIVTNVGCTVEAQALPNVVLRYTFHRSELQNWRSVHEHVMHQFLSVVKVHPSDMIYANSNSKSKQGPY